MASGQNGLYLGDRPAARTEIEQLHAKESLQKLYNYNPVPTVLTAGEAEYIKGATGAIWTEYARTGARIEYTLLPRMLAIAELVWTPLQNKNYNDFRENRLPRALAKFDAKGIRYRVPVAIGMVDTLMQGAQFTIALKPSVEGAKIYYTIDGYPANETDEVYSTPLTFNIPQGQQRELQTVVVTLLNNKSTVTRTVMYNRPQPENNTYSTANALTYRLYKGSFKSVSGLDTLKPMNSDTISTLNTSGFRDSLQHFGVQYDGYIKLDLDGTYTFSIASDGPAQLFINDKLIVDNNGAHGLTEKPGTVTDLRGLKRISIKYANGPENHFKVYYAAPDHAKVEIPNTVFSNFWIGKDKTGIDAQ